VFTPEELAEHQADAESLMQDTFAAFEPTGRAATGPGGMEVTTFTPRGTTKGKAQAGSRQGGDVQTRTVRIGNVELPVIEGGLHIPIGSTVPAVGWEYECTVLGAASDPAMLNRRYRVVGVPAKSWATARRLDVVEVPS